MNNLGIANIFEKKNVIIDGKELIYYEKIDSVCGLFSENREEFAILSGKMAGRVIETGFIYRIASFKTIRQLCNCDGVLYLGFLEKYRYGIGKYYIYNCEKNLVSPITNQELLQKIRGANKDNNRVHCKIKRKHRNN